MADIARAARHRFPWGTVNVSGGSMLPNLADGDRVLVRHGARVRPGDVVLAVRPDRPEAAMVKRVRERRHGGWWLLGDNPHRSTDSRDFGPVPDELVMARAIAVRRKTWPWLRRIGSDNPFES
ncbi:nickel-type superoxide dismutase maturation protease [Yinghuangia sp. YIM S09857]|uniref:nickel-type superoxide dismutase maturation protease n=1 Tax=Yinghuangia sp. YIM S09857 TaxID=3436929 RepID=UPI003F536C2A